MIFMDFKYIKNLVGGLGKDEEVLVIF